MRNLWLQIETKCHKCGNLVLRIDSSCASVLPMLVETRSHGCTASHSHSTRSQRAAYSLLFFSTSSLDGPLAPLTFF